LYKMQHGSTRCDACGKVTSAALQRCSRCHKATYCNRDCQKAHWAKHKLVCHPPNNKRFATAAPQSKDFPSPLNCFEFVKSSEDLHENILILLHGLGMISFIPISAPNNILMCRRHSSQLLSPRNNHEPPSNLLYILKGTT